MPNIRRKVHAIAIATAAASSLAAFVVAQPTMAFVLRGTLSDITFESLLDPMPVTANGSFDYDTVADTYSNINIAMSDGVTFSSSDVFTGTSSFFLIQKSPTTTNLSLTFSTPLTSVTPPDFVELNPGPNVEIGCLFGTCYIDLTTPSTFRKALAEQSIQVTEVPAPPALVGTILAGVAGFGFRFRKKPACVNKA
jgi:hypothetical protein